jgi:ASC-1-like (ASCH) protein
MQHVAILNKKWKLLDKIISGEKTIESRWYLSKRAPWDKIKKGETIYFKESADKVKAKATVEKILQFENLDNEKIKKLLKEYELPLGIKDLDFVKEKNKNKKYCILTFLKDVKEIEPFEIDKKGFGLMSAWICIDNIDKIKK